MIQERVVIASHSYSVESFVLFFGGRPCCCASITTIRTDKSGDSIGSKTERSATEGDAFTRSCLSCYGDIRVRTGQASLESDISADIKDDGARPFHLGDAIAESTFCRVFHVVFEGRDMIDDASSATNSIATLAFGTRESEGTRAERPYVAFIYIVVLVYLIYSPVVCIEGREGRSNGRSGCRLGQ